MSRRRLKKIAEKIKYCHHKIHKHLFGDKTFGKRFYLACLITAARQEFKIKTQLERAVVAATQAEAVLRDQHHMQPNAFQPPSVWPKMRTLCASVTPL